jgi:hypothetical protein
MHIMTVEGPVRQQDVGFTLSHEHVLCDLWPILNSYDGILDDEDMAVLELESFRTVEPWSKSPASVWEEIPQACAGLHSEPVSRLSWEVPGIASACTRRM